LWNGKKCVWKKAGEETIEGKGEKKERKWKNEDLRHRVTGRRSLNTPYCRITHGQQRGQIQAATARRGRIFNKREGKDGRIDWNESGIEGG
jgi:hypothetical protein